MNYNDNPYNFPIYFNMLSSITLFHSSRKCKLMGKEISEIAAENSYSESKYETL